MLTPRKAVPTLRQESQKKYILSVEVYIMWGSEGSQNSSFTDLRQHPFQNEVLTLQVPQ